MNTTPTVLLDIRNLVTRVLAEKCAAQAGLRVLASEDAQAPDLCVRQAGPDPEAEERALEAFRQENPDTGLLLLGDTSDAALIVAAMHAGVLEFLSESLGEDDLLPRFEQFAQERLASAGGPAPGRLVSVFCLKGGVGGTTLAVNVALERQRAAQGRERAAALLDLGLPYGEAQMFLDLNCRYHWGEAVKNVGRLDGTYLLSLMTQHASGLRLLPPPAQPDEIQLAGAEVMGFLAEQARRLFDTVVVDLGAYLDEVSQRIMDISDDVLLVCVQSTACLRNLARFAAQYPVARSRRGRAFRLVVNRHLEKAQITPAQLEEAAGIAGAWLVPNDYPATLGAINQGLPLAEAAPKAPVTEAVRALALSLDGGPQRPERKARFGLFALGKG
ncbi:hypothetical protein NNJEOMEG_01517 [Fundidesulfovibrio magnetotacticus]|uniref:Flp pilus assembly protein, ATPase CpaE n=1 Tax=Fundidesulfovibrio magnetotacticus TaxID=2730080 RepID=A0A6V8LLW6_9BACT|nr:cobyrinic acid a,c-diamide synthase [Fundidesulfovibrio magnetotacticus]GFK93683.1 hypothetical protein NNJEOMEG_01517 [Fundidesulfovibrio magnetotacticus]